MATGHNLALFVQSFRGLSLLERHLLLTVLAIYRNKSPCALSVDRWAVRLGVHRASVYRALNNLEGTYLERISRPGRTSLFKPTPRVCAVVYQRSHTGTSPGQVHHRAVRGLRKAGAHSARSVPRNRPAIVRGPLARSTPGGNRDARETLQPTGQLSDLQRFILGISEKVPTEEPDDL